MDIVVIGLIVALAPVYLVALAFAFKVGTALLGNAQELQDIIKVLK